MSKKYAEINIQILLALYGYTVEQMEMLNDDGTFLKVYSFEDRLIDIDLFDGYSTKTIKIILDKSTAIKFAKTLRTEINKIKE